ncbi:hypothetical protein HLB23_05505 [Nocardia uniformis]|uniref:Uncharacterized protein n=1 Tax=Nocardia uniformis TaxID=53432 RepID=A0A849BRP8_9NOCA|nr:hypothetical protein [Nocardia uniformis]NNH69332.1 hypothetical protein [Nocardia uniformis]
MSDSTALPLRLWRVQPLSANPLMRTSDRFEAVIRVLAIALAMLAVPLAGAAGTAAYTSSAERIRTDNSAKTVVTATVTGDPERKIRAEHNGTEEWFEAPVRWSLEGRSAMANVSVPGSTAAGDAVPVWIGPDGTPTGAPQSPGAAAAHGIARGLLVLLAIWGGSVAVVVFVDLLLSGRRNARWESEWRSLNRPLGHDAQ